MSTFRPTCTRLAEKISQLNPMLTPSASSILPFLHERIVLRPMNAPLPMRMPVFDSPLASIRQLLRQHDDELIFDERAQAGPTDDEGCVLLAGRHAWMGELVLDARNGLHSHPRSRYHASVLRMPSRRPTRGS